MIVACSLFRVEHLGILGFRGNYMSKSNIIWCIESIMY